MVHQFRNMTNIKLTVILMKDSYRCQIIMEEFPVAFLVNTLVTAWTTLIPMDMLTLTEPTQGQQDLFKLVNPASPPTIWGTSSNFVHWGEEELQTMLPSFDPVFLNIPMLLRVACSLNTFAFVTGLQQPCCKDDFLRWYQMLAQLFAGAPIHSTVLYFTWLLLMHPTRCSNWQMWRQFRSKTAKEW